jgi:EpsI family protein
MPEVDAPASTSGSLAFAFCSEHDAGRSPWVHASAAGVIMTVGRVRALVVLLLVIVTLGATAAWRPTRHLADELPKLQLDTLFPRSFGEWRVDEQQPVLLVSPDSEALLKKLYNQTLSRTYVSADGRRVMLSVAYGGDQSDATRAHRPEVCYPAQGFQMLASSTQTLPVGNETLKVRRLVAQQGGRYEPITYWIVVGGQVTSTGIEQKLAQLHYGAQGLVPDGMLVRVSSIERDDQAAFNLHGKFVSDLAGAMLGQEHSRVFGAKSAIDVR